MPKTMLMRWGGAAGLAIWLGAVMATAAIGGSRPVVAQAPQGPTFYKDVLPILQKNCQECHRPGQIGPMALLTYEHARPWARSIKAKVLAREMPPWFADPQYNEFANDRRLSDRDLNTIVSWVDGGAVAGDPKDAPPPVQFSADGWQIKPDLIVDAVEYKVPAKGIVEWQNVTVPSGFTTEHVDHLGGGPARRALRRASCVRQLQAARAGREVSRAGMAGQAAR